YFSELLKQAPVDAASARRILEQAGREIDSDYELASLLIARIDKLMVDESTQKAFFDAARTIESDYELRRVLAATLKRGTMAGSLGGGLLDAARAIESDTRRHRCWSSSSRSRGSRERATSSSRS
ncbi:MAG: hypothetical protein M3Q38_03500, partial [Chloroflexota bacterium]|nr:hypothetical protein [Chloroflexota bacterium]